MPANPNRIEVYMRPDRREKLVGLAERLAKEGEPVHDNRGHLSLSAVIGVLIDRAADAADRKRGGIPRKLGY